MFTIDITEDHHKQTYPLYCYAGPNASGVYCNGSSLTLNSSEGGSRQLNTIDPSSGYVNSSTGTWAFFPIVGTRISFHLNVSQVPYGHNFAVYTSCLTRGKPYRDAQSGVAEVDLVEANRHAFHTTLHQYWDHGGQSVGRGGTIQGGAANFEDVHGQEKDPARLYGPNLLIDTHRTFSVTIDFIAKANVLESVVVQLVQGPHTIRQIIRNKSYLKDLSSQISGRKNTLIVSLWSGYMNWLDGGGWESMNPIQGTVSDITWTTLPSASV